MERGTLQKVQMKQNMLAITTAMEKAAGDAHAKLNGLEAEAERQRARVKAEEADRHHYQPERVADSPAHTEQKARPRPCGRCERAKGAQMVRPGQRVQRAREEARRGTLHQQDDGTEADPEDEWDMCD